MKLARKNNLLAALLAAVMMLTVILGGCSSAPSSQVPESSVPESSAAPDSSVPESSQEPSSDPEPVNNPEISEHAMDNFLAKLEAGNYVMDVAGFMKTTVCSEDLVLFDYEDDSMYRDFAVMSVNSEVFQGFFTSDGVRDVSFITEGKALDTAAMKLPTALLSDSVSQGNIYNVFYNDMEEPLKFVSHDANVQNLVRTFANYGDVALRYMHEVYLIMDAEDPTEVHIQVQVDDDEVARYYFDDIDVVITFGTADSDARAVSWMNSPVYPEARTEWDEVDLFVFDSVFLPGYGAQSVPFFENASYALTVDQESFVTDDAVYIRDGHATQQDLADYAALLKEKGFEEVEVDGQTEYWLPIREETRCYSSITLEYDNGMNLTAKKAYDFPKYEGLDSINEQIKALRTPELPDPGDVLTNLNAIDRKAEQTESWLYFFDYGAVLYVTANYTDEQSVQDYLDSYCAILASSGFMPVFADKEESEAEYLASADGSTNFRYHFEDDGETVILLYKNEKYLSAGETQEIISGEGFPAIDLTGIYVSGRDHKKFQEVMYGRNYNAAISFETVFETEEAAGAFLDEYVVLLDDAGFLNGPGALIGSNKMTSYRDEEKGIGLAIDFYPSESGETRVYFEFKSGIDFETEPDDEEEGPKPILGSKNVNELKMMK